MDSASRRSRYRLQVTGCTTHHSASLWDVGHRQERQSRKSPKRSVLGCSDTLMVNKVSNTFKLSQPTKIEAESRKKKLCSGGAQNNIKGGKEKKDRLLLRPRSQFLPIFLQACNSLRYSWNQKKCEEESGHGARQEWLFCFFFVFFFCLILESGKNVTFLKIKKNYEKKVKPEMLQLINCLKWN